MSELHQPVRIGAWELPNRIVMAPLTRCRASDGRVPNALMAKYYKQRSSAGLILAEATSISPMGVGYPDTPGLWSAERSLPERQRILNRGKTRRSAKSKGTKAIGSPISRLFKFSALSRDFAVTSSVFRHS